MLYFASWGIYGKLNRSQSNSRVRSSQKNVRIDFLDREDQIKEFPCANLYKAKITHANDKTEKFAGEFSGNQVIFSFNPNYDIEIPKTSNPDISSSFQFLVKKRWEKRNSKNQRTEQINLMRKQYCFKSAQTQTNLSLINLSNYLNFGNLSVILINNLLDNLLKRRNRYKDEFYDFAMLLYLTSNKSYSILRQVLPFPYPVCLHSFIYNTSSRPLFQMNSGNTPLKKWITFSTYNFLLKMIVVILFSDHTHEKDMFSQKWPYKTIPNLMIYYSTLQSLSYQKSK